MIVFAFSRRFADRFNMGLGLGHALFRRNFVLAGGLDLVERSKLNLINASDAGFASAVAFMLGRVTNVMNGWY